MGEELDCLDSLGSFGIEREAKFSIDPEFPCDGVWSAIDPDKEAGVGLQ